MLSKIFGTPKEKPKPKKLKFKQGDMVRLIIAGINGMITQVFLFHERYDYVFEYWDYNKNCPSKLYVAEFELKKAKKVRKHE